MNLVFSLLSLGLILSSGFIPSYLVKGQCLSYQDKDVASAKDVDMSGIQDFNIDLFKRLIPKAATRNFVFSPYSIWNALVLAYFGSAGETERQLAQVLRVTNKLSAFKKWRQLEYMYNMRPSTTVDNTFVLSNRAYFDSSVRLQVCMEDLLHNELLQLDLMKKPNEAATVINNFVAETTRGHIKQLVSPDDIRFAHMVLVNAAYFKGNWQTTFDPKHTRDRTFENLDGEKFEIPMMSRFGLYNYSYDDTNAFHTVELPYVGNVISMYLFLPYDAGAVNFNKMVNNLNNHDITKLLDSMFETKMHVHLPKFSLETIVEEELLQALFSMGIKDAFVQGKANFNDFSFNPKLYLDEGIHKAFININEEGTEAAAATAFIVNKVGGSSIFNCNKPFVFVIIDKQTRNFLFMGAFKSPAPKKQLPPSDYTITPKPHNVPSGIYEPTDLPDTNEKPFDMHFGIQDPSNTYSGSQDSIIGYSSNPEPSSEHFGLEEPSREHFGLTEPSREHFGFEEPSTEDFGPADPSTTYTANHEASNPYNGDQGSSTPYTGNQDTSISSTGIQDPSRAYSGNQDPPLTYPYDRNVPSAGFHYAVKG